MQLNKHRLFGVVRLLATMTVLILSNLSIARAQLSEFEVINLEVPNASRYTTIQFVDINNRNQVVGYAKVGEENGVMLLYLPEPAYDLPAGVNVIQIPGENAVPIRINDNGVVCGYLGDIEKSVAFTWSERVVTKFRFTNQPDDRSKANAISNNGYITGTAFVGDYQRGFVRRPDQLLIPDPTDQITAVNSGKLTMIDINTSGQAVGDVWLSEAVFTAVSRVWERPIVFGGRYGLILTSAGGLQQMEELIGSQRMKVVIAWLNPVQSSPPGSVPQLHIRIYGPQGSIVFDKSEGQLVAGEKLDQLKALMSQMPTPQASNFSAEGQHIITETALAVANFRLNIGTEISLITPHPYETIVWESVNGINDLGQIVGATPTSNGSMVYLHLPVPDSGLPAGIHLLSDIKMRREAGGLYLNNKTQIVTSETFWNRGVAFDLASLLPNSEHREIVGAYGLNDFGNVVARLRSDAPGSPDGSEGIISWAILDTGLRRGSFSITLEPDKPSYKVGETIVLRTKLKHAEPGPLTYAFPGGPFGIIPDFFEYRPREGASDPPDPTEPLFEPVEPFVLTPEDRIREYATPLVPKKRGVTLVVSQVKVTNALDDVETFTVALPVVIDPLDTEITITNADHLLNQTPEEDWGTRAKALNAERRADGLEAYSNLIEIEVKLTNASEIDVENITVPGAVDRLSLIASIDAQKPGVPLTPIRFYSHDGSTIDLTDTGADPTIADLTLAPGEEATFAWVVDAYDANPDPELDDSADLRFKALILSSVGGRTIRNLVSEEFAVIDRPLLEWGIRPKDGRTSYQSGQVVRVDGYIENISTKDGRPPQDIRVMVYQLPEGNLGGGFMFDADQEGQPTPKYYEIFELPAEGPGSAMNLSAVFRSFPTVEASDGKVKYGVHLWTVKEDPENPEDPEALLGEVVVKASSQAILKEGWRKDFGVTFSPNRPAFTSQDDCYALKDVVPDISGILPFLCGLEEGLTIDLTDGIIGLGEFLFKSGELTLDAGKGIVLWEIQHMGRVWRAVQGDAVAQAALFQEAYVQYRTFVEMGVMAGEAGSKIPMAFEQFSTHAVGAMSDFFFAIEKGKVDDVQFAVGKFLGANPDLLLEPLVVARNYQRMSKAMMALEGELIDNSIRASVRAENARQATSMEQRLKDAAAAGKAPETALLPGDILSDSKLYHIFGVTIDQRKAIQKIAKDMGVIITFRPRNPLSIKILREGRGYPKPQSLKHKTVNQIDIDYLGYRQDAKATLEMVEPPAGLLDSNGRALSGIPLENAINAEMTKHARKIGNNKVLEQEVRERIKLRAEEWNKLFYDKLDTKKPGTLDQKVPVAFEANVQYVPGERDMIKEVGAAEKRTVQYEPVAGREPRTWKMTMTGPNDGPAKAITGDVDFMSVLDEAGGLIRDPQKRREIYVLLATALDMQHGESFTFFLQNARKEYLEAHVLGKPDAEAMAAISGVGDGTPRAAYYVDNLSIIDDPGAPNARHLPRRKKASRPIIDFILRPGQAKEIRRADPSGEFMLLDGIHITTKPPLDLVNRIVPYTLGERLEEFLTSPTFFVPALMVRIFERDGTPVTFSRSENAAVIQPFEANGDFALRKWTPAAGWQDITIDDAISAGTSGLLELLPMTILPGGGETGMSRVETLSQAAIGTGGDFFEAGDLVVINPGGPGEEFHTVRAIGSLVLSRALQQEHNSGVMVVSLGRDTTDRDGDGLTGWEEVVLHGTDPDNPDSDFNGIPDGLEIANGYNPLDPASGFEVNSFGLAPNGEDLLIQWNGGSGRNYSLQVSPTLVPGSWVEVRQITASGPDLLQSTTISNPYPQEPTVFFRFRLLPE